MSELEKAIEPISASADGRRNMFSFSCAAIGQSMNYAACQWRQGVLDQPDIKTPADWEVCDKARRAGNCTAVNMRKEEELAGKAIYFTDRSIFRKITDTATRWLMPSTVASRTSDLNKPLEHEQRASVVPKKAVNMLDAMGGAGGFADAITKSASESSAVSSLKSAPIMASVSGESPLQMARRLAAARVLS